MSKAPIEITVSVDDDAPPMRITIVRGGRIAHVLDERDASAQPAPPQREAEQ